MSVIPLEQAEAKDSKLTMAKQSMESNHKGKSMSTQILGVEPPCPTFETTKESGLDKNGDNALPVRVLESPEIDTKLSLCAVLIAFSALFISFLTVRLQIRHNRDEVRPILAIHLDINDMSIKIKNHGVGPAIFASMEWQNTKSKISANTLEELLDELWSGLNCGNSFYIYTKPFMDDLEDPDVLAPQEELYFIDGSRNNKHKMTLEEKRLLGQTFSGVKVTIIYTDLYRSGRWVLTKDLSYIAERTSMEWE